MDQSPHDHYNNIIATCISAYNVHSLILFFDFVIWTQNTFIIWLSPHILIRNNGTMHTMMLLWMLECRINLYPGSYSKLVSLASLSRSLIFQFILTSLVMIINCTLAQLDTCDRTLWTLKCVKSHTSINPTNQRRPKYLISHAQSCVGVRLEVIHRSWKWVA